MIKIKISKLGTDFIEINYGDFAANFEKSYYVFNKRTVCLLFDITKENLNISFTGSNFIVTPTLLTYIDTTATTVEEFYSEIKLLL